MTMVLENSGTIGAGDTGAEAAGVGTRAIAPPAYRWVVLLVCLIVMTTSFTIRIAWSSASTRVSADLGLNATMLGSFITAFVTGYVITNAVSGFAADRFGARIVVVVALVPLGLLVAAFGLIQSYAIGLAVQFGMGLTAGVNFSATTKLAAAWFTRSERGRAFGVLAASSSLAVIFANSIFPTLIERTSWHMLYYTMGAGVIAVAVFSLVLLRECPEGADRAVALQSNGNFLHAVREFLGERSYLLLGVAWLGGLWGTWGITFWANALMVKGHGLSNVAAGQVMALLGVGGLLAKPTYGWLSDVLPLRRSTMILPCFAGFAILLIVFGEAHSQAQFLMIAPLLGVFAFAYSPLMQAMLTEIIGTRNVGGAAGLMNAFTQIGALLAPLVVGFIFQLTSSFLFAFITLALGPVVAVIATLFIMMNGERQE